MIYWKVDFLDCLNYLLLHSTLPLLCQAHVGNFLPLWMLGQICNFGTWSTGFYLAFFCCILNDTDTAITFCNPNWYLTPKRMTSLEWLETRNVVMYLKAPHFITSMHYQLICHVYFAERCCKCSLCLKLMVKIYIHYIHKMNTLLSACSFFKTADQNLMIFHYWEGH